MVFTKTLLQTQVLALSRVSFGTMQCTDQMWITWTTFLLSVEQIRYKNVMCLSLRPPAWEVPNYMHMFCISKNNSAVSWTGHIWGHFLFCSQRMSSDPPSLCVCCSFLELARMNDPITVKHFLLIEVFQTVFSPTQSFTKSESSFKISTSALVLSWIMNNRIDLMSGLWEHRHLLTLCCRPHVSCHHPICLCSLYSVWQRMQVAAFVNRAILNMYKLGFYLVV